MPSRRSCTYCPAMPSPLKRASSAAAGGRLHLALEVELVDGLLQLVADRLLVLAHASSLPNRRSGSAGCRHGACYQPGPGCHAPTRRGAHDRCRCPVLGSAHGERAIERQGCVGGRGRPGRRRRRGLGGRPGGRQRRAGRRPRAGGRRPGGVGPAPGRGARPRDARLGVGAAAGAGRRRDAGVQGVQLLLRAHEPGRRARRGSTSPTSPSRAPRPTGASAPRPTAPSSAATT